MFLFGAGVLYATQLQDSAGAAVANATPIQFGTLQDVSGDISFEEKLLYGSKQFPVAFGRGKGKLDFKAKMAGFTGVILSDLLFGQASSAGIKGVVTDFAAAVPGVSTYTIAVSPPSSGTWASDLGVRNASTGRALKKVASAPATGQYSVATGTYTFAAADANMAVLINYEYTATSTSAKYGTIANQLMGYAPTFSAMLTVSYAGKALTLNLNRCIASKFSLPMKNDDFTIPDFDFTAIADDSDNLGYWATSE